MSVWFQQTTTAFNNGGTVAAHLLPPNGLVGNIIGNSWASGTTAWSRNGPLQNWEQIASLPNQYQGGAGYADAMVSDFKEGCYAWWCPASVDDVRMLTVDENCAHDFPTIVVSGQVNSSMENPVGQGAIGILKISTTYEWISSNQSYRAAVGSAYPGAMELVRNLLRNQPRVMTNDKHIAWWKTLLRSIGLGAAATLGTIATGGAALPAIAAGLTAGAGALI